MISNRTRCNAIAVALLALASCHVDRDAVYQHVYACDPKAVDPGCGQDRDQQEMMCFAGRTLGGTDFCAQQCTTGPQEGTVCAQSGARLATCQLTDGPERGDCGNPALGCFRNNVLSNTGACLTISPCTEDADCRDPVRATCATAFVKKIYSTPTTFKNNNLWCLQAGCQERRTACSPGESCLRDLVPVALHPPDICVPNCDSNLHCPPAHFCYRKVSGPAAPNICLPGLMGFRCDTSMDCMMGECMATDGFSMCTTKCSGNNDCAGYDGEQGKFFCNDAKYCTTPDAFRGSVCYGDSDCSAGLTCAFLSADSSTGNCLPPCGADGSCAPRGGIPHTCLPRADGKGGACFPGYFGYPCQDNAACLPDLSCRALGPGQPNICTTLCADDSDCAKNRWAAAGYCQELKDMAIKVCLTPRSASQPCDRDTQCQSHRCLERTDGTKACAPATGSRP
jgi:hypothetical protein